MKNVNLNKFKKWIISAAGFISVATTAGTATAYANEIDNKPAVESTIDENTLSTSSLLNTLNVDNTTGSAITINEIDDNSLNESLEQNNTTNQYESTNYQEGNVYVIPAGEVSFFIEGTIDYNGGSYQVENPSQDTYMVFFQKPDGGILVKQSSIPFSKYDDIYTKYYNEANGIIDNNVENQTVFEVQFNQNVFNDTYANGNNIVLPKNVEFYNVKVNFVDKNGNFVETMTKENIPNPHFGIADSTVAILNGKVINQDGDNTLENKITAFALRDGVLDSQHASYTVASQEFKNTFNGIVIEGDRSVTEYQMVIEEGTDFAYYMIDVTSNNSVYNIKLPYPITEKDENGNLIITDTIKINTGDYNIGDVIKITANANRYTITVNDEITKEVTIFEEEARNEETESEDITIEVDDKELLPEEDKVVVVEEQIKVVKNEDCIDSGKPWVPIDPGDKDPGDPWIPIKPSKPSDKTDLTDGGVELPPYTPDPETPVPDPEKPTKDPEKPVPVPDPETPTKDPNIPNIEKGKGTGAIDTFNDITIKDLENSKNINISSVLAGLTLAGLAFLGLKNNEKIKNSKIVKNLKKTAKHYKDNLVYNALGLNTKSKMEAYKKYILV